MNVEASMRRARAVAFTAGREPTHWQIGYEFEDRMRSELGHLMAYPIDGSEQTFLGFRLVRNAALRDGFALCDGPVPDADRERVIRADLSRLQGQIDALSKELRELMSRRVVERSTIISSNGDAGEGLDRPKTAV